MIAEGGGGGGEMSFTSTLVLPVTVWVSTTVLLLSGNLQNPLPTSLENSHPTPITLYILICGHTF